MENKKVINLNRVNFILVSRNDCVGKTSFTITSSVGDIRFRDLSSVLDFIDMNKDLGFIV